MKRAFFLIALCLSMVGCAFLEWMTGSTGTTTAGDPTTTSPILEGLSEGFSALGEATLDSGPVAGWLALIFTTLKSVNRQYQAKKAKEAPVPVPVPPAPTP